MKPLSNAYLISQPILQAIDLNLPLVALESAVITHGLPRPENLNLALALEADVRANGANPATVALLDGKVRVGLAEDELERLANLDGTRKISLRDFGIALAEGLSGGTTVAATSFVASRIGIRVFATGGIGGVHRGAPFDVSADLPQLGKTPIMIVCAGAKSILDLPATREVLETQGVTILGYRTDEIPAFYTRSSGLAVDYQVESAEEAAKIAMNSWDAGIESAVLLVVPPPEATAMPGDVIEKVISAALAEAEQKGIHGAATTPFLLQRVSELTGGESLRANIDLLRNNASVAAQVAVAMAGLRKSGPF
ncbi:MAG: pseudouridine-5'-phosphate glycosidase [Anaerolineaceae bacterium]|nr:pseudouridine-5'-phosphate glycosidase [Anaerolineaceae bacterium]